MAEKARVQAKTQESKQKCPNSCKQNTSFHSSGSAADMILQLQRTAGNQAVQKLIKSGALQTKLRVGQPNDPSTHEKTRYEKMLVPVSEEMPAVREKPSAIAKERAATPIPRKAIAPAISAIRHRAVSARRRPPASAPVAAALAAGENPDTEQIRTDAEQTVKNLDADAAKAEEVKRDEFKDKLKKAIKDKMPQPKTESDAKKVMKTGATDASNVLREELATERDAATGPLKHTAAVTEEPHSTQPTQPQTDLQIEQVGAPPAPVSAAPVVPTPLPPLDYSSDRAPTDQMMAENNVTQEQLVEGNDPAFGPSLQSRSTAEKHEATVEARYRQSESKVRSQAQGAAQQALMQGLTGLHSVRELRINKVAGQQLDTKNKSLDERQKITDKVNSIKDKTRREVKEILEGMENEATRIFGDGLRLAEDAYKDTFEEEKGGAWTWATTWGSDWEELIEKSLGKAREKYLLQVNKAIDEVANFVEARLKAAKQRVTDGRKEVDDFVKGLGARVEQFGQEALEAVRNDFDAMVTDIDQRRDGLIDKMSQQYKDSYERMSAMEEKFREENKSLWQRVYDATVGLIKKIIEFKDMLLSVLGRAVEVIGDIIAHPVRFLGNLISGVMQGLENFMGKIDIYLQKGLMEWLFGTLASTGLQMPDKFDLKGIISIVLQILGLTYAKFRARAVSIVGEPVVAALEKAAEVFKIFITEGIPGLWRFIMDKLSDLKSTVLDAIFDFIKDRVIMAGITWIIGLLNPASAFFKACKAIYDIVMFFINRGKQIIDLVNAVVDSIGAIAKGAIGTAASLVEGALAKAIPVAIGFLASLLGLGDPAKPVRNSIEKARTPVDKAIDWVINLAVKGVKAAGKLVGGLFGKKDEPVREQKVEMGKAEHDAKVEVGLDAIDRYEMELLAKKDAISLEKAEHIASRVKTAHPIFQSIIVLSSEEGWIYEYTASKGRKPGHSQGKRAKELAKKLAPLKGKGAASIIVFLKSKKIEPWFKYGFMTQAERALDYEAEGLLVAIEAQFSDPKTGKLSRFDLVIRDPEGRTNNDGSVLHVLIEVKNWTGFENWDKEKQDARLRSLAKQLAKYKKAGLPVRLEWKGRIPERILRRFESFDIESITEI